jgi:hypothetical protein
MGRIATCRCPLCGVRFLTSKMVQRFIAQKADADILFSQESLGYKRLSRFMREANVYRLKDAPPGSDQAMVRDALKSAIAALYNVWLSCGLIREGDQWGKAAGDMFERLQSITSCLNAPVVASECRTAPSVAARSSLGLGVERVDAADAMPDVVVARVGLGVGRE